MATAQRRAGTAQITQLDVAGEAVLYDSFRRFWHPVMYSGDLATGPVGVVLLGEKLVLVRLADTVRCFADLCFHRGTALSLGCVEDDQLRCAYHGWTYGSDGMCTSIPARHGANIPKRARLQSYLVKEKDGLIWVSLDPDPLFPIPEFPEFSDPGFRTAAVPATDWQCGAARRVENFVDFAHFAWVHDGILGDRRNPIVPEHEVWREGAELRFKARDFAEPTGTTKTSAVTTSRSRVMASKNYRLFLPLTIYLRQTLEDGSNFVLFMSASPVQQDVNRFFTFNARDYALDEPDEKFVSFQQMILEQDRVVAESQRPEELPFDLSAELHIRGVDKVSVEYRKWLIELANDYVSTRNGSRE